MENRYSHNFLLGFNDKIGSKRFPKTKYGRLYIFYRYGSIRKKVVTDVKIQGQNWSSKDQHLIKSLRQDKDYAKEVEFIDNLKRRFNEMSINMSEGKISIETAFSKLLNKNPEGYVVKWLEDSKVYTEKTKEKYISWVKSAEKHLKYNPVKFIHIQDLNTCRDIANSLKNAGLKNNTIREYLQAFDSVTENVPLKIRQPFRNNRLKPSSNDTDNIPRSPIDILKALLLLPYPAVNKNPKEWYLALNLWLYSFSLRGLTGKDIPNISEKFVQGAKYELPYFPDYMSNKEYSSLGGKSYLVMRRGKTAENKSMTILLNSVPSFLLHQSLKQLIKEVLPEYAYQGKDKLRLFNFVTKDDKYNASPEGERKWNVLQDRMFRRLKPMLKVGLHNTRHTYTSMGNSFANLTDAEQREQIGQKTKGALKHYQTPHQIRADINHMSILDDFNLLFLVKNFFSLGYTKEYLSHRLTQGAINLVKEKRLMSFSAEEMFRLEQLKTQWEWNPKATFNEEGDLILSKSEKPQELIELEKRMSIYYETSDPDYDWRQEATKEIFGFISKRDKFLYEEGYADHMSIKLMQEYEDKQSRIEKRPKMKIIGSGKEEKA